MFYFSQLKNSKLETEHGVSIGKLVDLVFDFKSIPKVTKLVVLKRKKNQQVLISTDFVRAYGEKIILSKDYGQGTLEENELFVTKNIVDKQIIDIGGRKVVRVNDVLFQPRKNNQLIVAGVDTSMSGIMRWFGLESWYHSLASTFGHGTPRILPWSHIQPLELAEGKVVLKRQQERLQQFHPADLADFLETTTVRNVIKTLNLLDQEFGSEVLAELNLNYQMEIFRKMDIKKSAEILSLMDPDEAVDVLLQFNSKKRQQLLKRLTENKQTELNDLLRFSATTVGQYLTTEFVKVQKEMSAGDVLQMVSTQTAHFGFLEYVYVVNNNNQLIGVFNLHELVQQKEEKPVYTFMTPDVVVVHLSTPIKSVFRKLIKYKISAIPVVNSRKKIVGIVTADDIGETFIDKI